MKNTASNSKRKCTCYDHEEPYADREMSYDVNVWSSIEPDLEAVLPDRERWRAIDLGFEYGRRDWSITIDKAAVEDEDVPEAVAAMLPGIRWLTEMSLSPIGAPDPGRAFLRRAATAIAKESHGVVEDKQTDEMRLPSGVKRFSSPERTEKVALLTLSWWVNDDRLRDSASLGKIIDLLKSHLPEAVARRYGEYEPPKFKLAEQGEEHFRRFVSSTPTIGFGGVFYTTRPVTSFHLSNDETPGPSRLGYRANRLEIEAEASALAQAGWAAQLMSTWRAISLHLRPFFADVRVLRGFDMARGRIWVGSDAEEHPVRSWWWTGIPRTAPLAAVIGVPYVDLWPSVMRTGDIVGDLVFLSPDVWSIASTIDGSIWAPPERIAAPEEALPIIGHHHPARTYPPEFPFETRIT